MNGLKALVAIMGALIVVMMGVVGYGLYQKAVDPEFRFFDLGGKEAAAPASGPVSAPTAPLPAAAGGYDRLALGLPEGTEVHQVAADGGRLFLHLRLADGTERVLTLNAATGEVLGTIDVNR